MVKRGPVIPMVGHSNESLMRDVSIILAVFAYALEKWTSSILGWKITGVITSLFVFAVIVAIVYGIILGMKVRKYRDKEVTQMVDPNNKKVYTKP